MANTLHPDSRRVCYIHDKTFVDGLYALAEERGISFGELVRETLYKTYAPGQVDPVTARDRAGRGTRSRGRGRSGSHAPRKPEA